MTVSGIITDGLSGASGCMSQHLTVHYVYQRIHALAGRPLHLAAHLDLAARAMQHIYGTRPDLDERAIASKITELLRTHRFPAEGSATVLVRLIPDGKRHGLIIEPERPLLDCGHALSSLRPKVFAYEYDIPYSTLPTGFQLSAAALFDSLALRQGNGDGAVRSVRRKGERLLACGAAPLFAIKGKTIFTASLTEGAIESVERRLVMNAAAKARLDILEEAPLHSELKDIDELFYADAAGITSLSECDGTKFMSLLASRLILHF